MAKQARTTGRQHLRLGDLMRREAAPSRIMNVKIPAPTLDAIEGLAKSTGASKTEVVIALLNEGLAAMRQMKR